MNTSLIELYMGKLILNHLVGNNCPEFRSRLLDSCFFKLALRSDGLELYFRVLALKTILTQQYFKNTSHFKPELQTQFGVYAVFRFHMFIINDYYSKSKRL